MNNPSNLPPDVTDEMIENAANSIPDADPFTQGPWNLHRAYDAKPQEVRGDDGKRWISRSHYVAKGDMLICEVIMAKDIDEPVNMGWPRVSDDAEFEANCRLIASARELYDALASILESQNVWPMERRKWCESILRKVRGV